MRFLRGITNGLVLGAAWLLLCGASLDTYRAVDRGERALASGNSAAAVDAYQEALTATPDDPSLIYNLGTATLAAGDAQAASGLLNDAISLAKSQAEAGESVNPALAARGAFNLGNALMGQSQEGDPQQSAEALKGAISAYRQAVAANPTDGDARRNLQLAATALKQAEQQQSEQKQDGENEEKKDGEQGQSGENKPGDKQSGDKQSDQDPSDGQQGESGSEDQDAQKQDGDSTDPSESSQTGDKDDNGQQPQDGDGEMKQQQVAEAKMNPEDVERLLGSLSRGEAATMREAMRRAMGPPQQQQVEQDW